MPAVTAKQNLQGFLLALSEVEGLFIVPDILRQFFLAFAERKGIVNNKVILAVERFAIHILRYLYLIVFKGEQRNQLPGLGRSEIVLVNDRFGNGHARIVKTFPAYRFNECIKRVIGYCSGYCVIVSGKVVRGSRMGRSSLRLSLSLGSFLPSSSYRLSVINCSSINARPNRLMITST